MEDVEIVELPALKRGGLPRWVVRHSGVELGEIRTVRLRGARLTFFRALATIPGSREFVDLELDTDRETQVRKLLEFSRDPLMFERHLTYSQRRDLFGSGGQQAD